MRTLRRPIVALVAGAIIMGTAHAGVPDQDRDRARLATSYVSATQNEDGSFGYGSIGATADGIIALAAAGRGAGAIDKAYSFIGDQELTGLGDIAKVVQALVATGGDPRSYQGRNLVQELSDSLQPGGQYGGEGEWVYTHTLVMLALAAAGEDVDPNAATWLAQAQCGDGGWQFDAPSSSDDDNKCLSESDPSNDYTTSDTNTTALAAMALAAAPGPDAPKSPLVFLKKRRDPAGNGWGYDRTFSLTDANSTALVIQAYLASGSDIPTGAKAALRRLQYRKCSSSGPAFAYSYDDADSDGTLERSERTGPDAYATIGAILALLEEPFPVAAQGAVKGVPKISCG